MALGRDRTTICQREKRADLFDRFTILKWSVVMRPAACALISVNPSSGRTEHEGVIYYAINLLFFYSARKAVCPHFNSCCS